MFRNIYQQSVPGQLYHFDTDQIQTTLHKPSGELADMVYYYWLMVIKPGDVALEIIPDGAIDLVMSPEMPGFCAFYLPKIKKYSIPLVGPVRYFGVCFEPEAAQHCFGLNLKEMAALSMGSETKHAACIDDLVDGIQGIQQFESAVRVFDEQFSAMRSLRPKKFTQSIYQHFVESLDTAGVKEVAERVGVSERQFRRSVHDISGLTPKQMQRITRLQNLLRVMFDPNEIDGYDGFFDDSHRIKETKGLLGKTVGQIEKMSEKYNQSK